MGGDGSGRYFKKGAFLPNRRTLRYLKASSLGDRKLLASGLKAIQCPFTLARMNAYYLLKRKWPDIELPKILNRFYLLGGRVLDYQDVVVNSYTHTSFKDEAADVAIIKKLVPTLWQRHKYTPRERLAVVVLCIIGRELQFVEAVNHVLRTQQAPMPLPLLPLKIAKRLDTVQSASILPAKVSAKNDKIVRKNYDLVSWSLGRCTGDLVTIAYNLYFPLNSRGQTWIEFIETIISKTSAKCLLFNHTLETFKELDLISDDYADVPVRLGTNSRTFKSTFACDFNDFAVQVRQEFDDIGKENPDLYEKTQYLRSKVTGVSINIISCQFLKTLHNFTFPSKVSNWRGLRRPMLRKPWQRLLKTGKRRSKVFKTIV